MLTKNRFFSALAPPSNLVYIGAKGAFRNFLGSITKYGFLQIVQGGTLWVGRGSNPWGEGVRPPKSAPGQNINRWQIDINELNESSLMPDFIRELRRFDRTKQTLLAASPNYYSPISSRENESHESNSIVSSNRGGEAVGSYAKQNFRASLEDPSTNRDYSSGTDDMKRMIITKRLRKAIAAIGKQLCLEWVTVVQELVKLIWSAQVKRK